MIIRRYCTPSSTLKFTRIGGYVFLYSTMSDVQVENLSLKYDSAAPTSTQDSNKQSKSFWLGKAPIQVPNVLDPDDALMKRFQSALKEHLLRLANKLSEEILDLVRKILICNMFYIFL